MITISHAADGSVRVEVRGEIDLQTSARLRKTLVDTATGLHPRRIVVDLLYVTFIDSRGIGALVAGRNAARQLGIGYTLERPSAFVGQQLRQMGLHDSLVGEG